MQETFRILGMSNPDVRTILTIPANNTTMEPELRSLCPEIAPMAVASVPLSADALTLETLPEYLGNTHEAITPLLRLGPELLVYGCTAAGFLLGREKSEGFMRNLHDVCGVPIVSTGASMVEVLKQEGVSTTTLVTPYVKSVNDGLRGFLESAGIGVERLESFECESIEDLGRISEQQVFDLAVETATPRSSALFIACSQLPTLGILRDLRRRLGIPVWSSISATAWAAKRIVESAPSKTAAD